MKRICIVTATRAEYGLLRPIIQKLLAAGEYDVRVVATGMHLSPEFGLTYREIESDGINIDKKIEIQMSSDSAAGISKTMAMALLGFSDYFEETAFDLLIVLGDRTETLAVCCAAMNARIPIAHLYGGETTEGAVDECVRHAITKMSHLHFTSTQAYANRVIQLGEDSKRVFNVGAIGIENILNMSLLDREALARELDFDLSRSYAVITFHPVTLENNSAESQFKALLKACDAQPELSYIFTKANSDAGGRIINQLIDTYVKTHQNVFATESLGNLKYLSALKNAAFVMGNSSSGLVEAPTFHIPTINIGDRQKGRLQGGTIINCEPNFESISQAMIKALSDDFKHQIEHVINPYGDGKTSIQIINTIKNTLEKGSINIKKKFYDLEVEYV